MGKRKVSEVVLATVIRHSNAEPQLPTFTLEKFKQGDRVRVTVELLSRKEPRKS